MRGESVCESPLRGRVFSGIGEGEFYVSIYGKIIRRKLGIVPYPGTLNVRIEPGYVEKYRECLRRVEPVMLDPPSIPGARLARVKAYPAVLKGYRVWIVRPDITVYKDDVAEFVADVYLREYLNLRDGDTVEFEVVDP